MHESLLLCRKHKDMIRWVRWSGILHLARKICQTSHAVGLDKNWVIISRCQTLELRQMLHSRPSMAHNSTLDWWDLFHLHTHLQCPDIPQHQICMDTQHSYLSPELIGKGLNKLLSWTLNFQHTEVRHNRCSQYCSWVWPKPVSAPIQAEISRFQKIEGCWSWNVCMTCTHDVCTSTFSSELITVIQSFWLQRFPSSILVLTWLMIFETTLIPWWYL